MAPLGQIPNRFKINETEYVDLRPISTQSTNLYQNQIRRECVCVWVSVWLPWPEQLIFSPRPSRFSIATAFHKRIHFQLGISSFWHRKREDSAHNVLVSWSRVTMAERLIRQCNASWADGQKKEKSWVARGVWGSRAINWHATSFFLASSFSSSWISRGNTWRMNQKEKHSPNCGRL